MNQLNPLQENAVLIALQVHAALIQQTLQALAPLAQPVVAPTPEVAPRKHRKGNGLDAPADQPQA